MEKTFSKQSTKERGITLIALVVSIVLNCYRSGRKEECAA